MLSLYFDYQLFSFFLVWFFLGRDLDSDCTSSWPLLTFLLDFTLIILLISSSAFTERAIEDNNQNVVC